MGLKDQIKEANSVSEVKRLKHIAEAGFDYASPKTMRQIKREADRAIARINTPKKN